MVKIAATADGTALIFPPTLPPAVPTIRLDQKLPL
jgi:hypothetical protein